MILLVAFCAVIVKNDHAFFLVNATVTSAGGLITSFNNDIFEDLIVVLGCKLLTLEAVKCARCLVFNALSHVEGLDQAFAVVNAAVLLANTHVLLNLRSHEFSLNLFECDATLYALKMFRVAFNHFPQISTGLTSGLRERAIKLFLVTVINADCIITGFNSSFFYDLIVVLGYNLLALEAVKCARCLVFNALSHIKSLNKAFAVVNAAVLLANTHVLLNLRTHEFSFNLFG